MKTPRSPLANLGRLLGALIFLSFPATMAITHCDTLPGAGQPGVRG